MVLGLVLTKYSARNRMEIGVDESIWEQSKLDHPIALPAPVRIHRPTMLLVNYQKTAYSCGEDEVQNVASGTM